MKAEIVHVLEPRYGDHYEIKVNGEVIENLHAVQCLYNYSSVGMEEKLMTLEVIIKQSDITVIDRR